MGRGGVTCRRRRSLDALLQSHGIRVQIVTTRGGRPLHIRDTRSGRLPASSGFGRASVARHICRYALADASRIGHSVRVNRDLVERRRDVVTAVALFASWLGILVLVLHMSNWPVVVKMTLWLGVPLISGVLAPESWRSKVGLLVVPIVFFSWLTLSPWSGTSDTPPGWGFIRMTLGGAIFIAGVQYLAFWLGVLFRRFARDAGSRFT
jgi:hypothetical protein